MNNYKKQLMNKLGLKENCIIDNEKEEVIVKEVDWHQILDILGDGSCIAAYTFDGNANDLGGRYNGSWNGNEQYDNGLFEQAAKFDGNSEIVIYPEINNNDTLTISLWCYNNQSNSSDRTGLFYTGDYERDKTFRVVFYDGSVDFQYGASGTTVYSEKTQDWINKWIHLVILINPDFISIYKDGSNVFYKSGFGKTLDHKNKIHLGNGQWFFKGLIDQVRIFNRELTDKEIQYIYKKEKGE